uniref:Uracil-DNA glycosylase n=1 Tax=Heterorhabditis bacteriophora TaxID=37862 RepID=A0A1I7XUH9_HETBA
MKVNRYEKAKKFLSIVRQDRVLIVVPQASKHFESQNWTFQQSWAPIHGAKTTTELWREGIPDFWGKGIWPSNSSGQNPMDFAIWSIL